MQKRTVLRFFGTEVIELDDSLCPAPGAPEGAIAQARSTAETKLKGSQSLLTELQSNYKKDSANLTEKARCVLTANLAEKARYDYVLSDNLVEKTRCVLTTKLAEKVRCALTTA